MINLISSVICNAPRFCCNGNDQGENGCKGRCIPEIFINDGKKDCDNGSDEEGSSMFIL